MDMDIVPFSAYFPYIHPKDADALAVTCKRYQTMVDDEYRRVGRAPVLPHGCWHHHLGKRARDSVVDAATLLNYMPKALASLIDGRCIVCDRRLLARVSPWGFNAHPPCIRGLLLNTYYIPEKLGLSSQDIRGAIPTQRLVGYRLYTQVQYEYDAVFRRPYRRFVPADWTLKHVATVVHAAKVQRFQGEKRRRKEAAEALEAAKRQRRVMVEQKRADAVAKRKAALEAHPQVDLVRRVVNVMGARAILGDYLKPVLRAPTSLQNVVEAAQEHASLADARARRQVQTYLEAMVQRISAPTPSVRPVRAYGVIKGTACIQCRGNNRARECTHYRCGRCCKGCPRHTK